MPSADVNRQETARDRRTNIITTVEQHLGHAGTPALQELNQRLDVDQWMITGADIDSLISAALLAAASDGRWRVGVVIVRSRDALVAPQLGSLKAAAQRDDVYGVDLFSTQFPSISNHPLLFGTTTRQPRRTDVREECRKFDDDVLDALTKQAGINLSGWAGIAANFGAENHLSRYYKYPLGTAQLALACLEVIGRAPRLYDRQYLPWMIANCDGGLKTIRQYPWNVEAWWSALAAVAGPSSLSESVYQVATQQRPTEFIDVDRRLRYDEPTRAKSLRSDWNLAGESMDNVIAVTQLIRDLSGWPDPFGDVTKVPAWVTETPTGNILTLRKTAGTKTRPETPGLSGISMEHLKMHLLCARMAVHMNFSEFRERGPGLGWLLAEEYKAAEDMLGPTPDDLAPPPEEDEAALAPEDEPADGPEQTTLV